MLSFIILHRIKYEVTSQISVHNLCPSNQTTIQPEPNYRLQKQKDI
jgi:hypothetical protein